MDRAVWNAHLIVLFSYEYDALGNLIRETNALGNSNTYTYDKCGRVLTVTTPDDVVASTKTYDGNGNLLTDTDAKGYTTVYTYQNNRLTSVTDRMESSTYYAYNAYGETASATDACGNVTSYEYDKCGRLSKVTMPEGVTTEYTYDYAGNTLTQTDGEGHTTEYEYYPFGCLYSVTNADGNVESYVYDARGNMTEKTDGNGETVNYTYDAKNNLISAANGDILISYTYDALNNRTAMTDESGSYAYTYDWGDRLTKVTKNGESYLDYTYDTLGNVTSINGTAYTYDECNRIKTAGGVTYEYDLNGNLSSVTTPIGETAYAYDHNNCVTKAENKVDGAVQSSYEYTYYADGNVHTKTDNTGKTVTYTYDGAGRLTQVSEGTRTAVYTYDKAGNRTGFNETAEKTESVGGVEITYTQKVASYLYSKANVLTLMTEVYQNSEGEELLRKNVRYVYDGAGNQISSAAEYLKDAPEEATEGAEEIGTGYDSIVEVTINEYDGLNQLVNTTNIKDGKRTYASYVYNGDGLRVQKTVDGNTTDYVLSGGYIIAETGKTYLRGLSYHAVTVTGGGTFYYLANAHGDVTSVVNSSSVTVAVYEYDEFGNITYESGTYESEIRYAGEFYDAETGNYYLRARYYDPLIGRFTQQDSFLGYSDNPLSLNRYTYCHNNPIMFVDPWGHEERRLTIGDYVYNYNTDSFTSSDMDYEFSKVIGAAERGEINPMEFIRRSEECGVHMSLSRAYVDSGETLVLDMRFDGGLSYDDSITASGIIEGYLRGATQKDFMIGQINNLTAGNVIVCEVYATIPDDEQVGFVIFGNENVRERVRQDIIALTGDDRYYYDGLYLKLDTSIEFNGDSEAKGSKLARIIINDLMKKGHQITISFADLKYTQNSEGVAKRGINGTSLILYNALGESEEPIVLIHELVHSFVNKHNFTEKISYSYTDEYNNIPDSWKDIIELGVERKYHEAVAITIENAIRRDLGFSERTKDIIEPGGYGEFPSNYTSKESNNYVIVAAVDKKGNKVKAKDNKDFNYKVSVWKVLNAEIDPCYGEDIINYLYENYGEW